MGRGWGRIRVSVRGVQRQDESSPSGGGLKGLFHWGGLGESKKKGGGE